MKSLRKLLLIERCTGLPDYLFQNIFEGSSPACADDILRQTVGDAQCEIEVPILIMLVIDIISFG